MNGIIVVSVDLNSIPVEALKFVYIALHLINLTNVAVNLGFIVIHKEDKISQLLLCRIQDGFPILALLGLPVSHNAINSVLFFI